MDYRIFSPDGLIEASIELPLSKSMSNRALAIAALTPGGDPPGLRVAECDDTRVMLRAVAGERPASIDVEGAGTAMRFLTAVVAATPGWNAVIDGSARMRERPVGALVDALRACGAAVEYEGREGFPPLRVEGRALRGGAVELDASESSQFASALLMAAPVMARGLVLTLRGETASTPYIDMTIGMMRRAGADVNREGRVIIVAPGGYHPVDQIVEADWSAAAFWYEIQAMSSGFVSLGGLARNSLQGDSACSAIFENLGVVTDFDGEEEGMTDLTASPDLTPRLALDMSATPDLVPPLVVACAMLGVPFRLTGVATLRLKECDRLAALRTELLKAGVDITIEGDDTLWWEGRRVPVVELPVFDSHDDHRMAMSLAAVALYAPGIVVRDAEVVAKSYPAFWDDLRKAGFTVVDAAAAADAAAEGGAE